VQRGLDLRELGRGRLAWVRAGLSLSAGIFSCHRLPSMGIRSPRNAGSSNSRQQSGVRRNGSAALVQFCLGSTPRAADAGPGRARARQGYGPRCLARPHSARHAARARRATVLDSGSGLGPATTAHGLDSGGPCSGSVGNNPHSTLQQHRLQPFQVTCSRPATQYYS
jgi:hypothetical protein